MRRTIKTSALGLAAVALMAATSVQATPWSSFFVESSGAGIDRVTATISGGGVFSNPGLEAEFLNFPTWPTPLPGWTSANVANTATMENLGNPVTANLYYWINLSSDITQTFQIDQKSWNGSTLVDETIVSYDGTGASTLLLVRDTFPDGNGGTITVLDHPWSNTGFRNDLPLASSVPDGGSSLMLLGSSLAGLAWLRRRFGRC